MQGVETGMVSEIWAAPARKLELQGQTANLIKSEKLAQPEWLRG